VFIISNEVTMALSFSRSGPEEFQSFGQRRFLGSQVMKHRAMKGHEAQGSSLESSKAGKTPKCSRADKAIAGSNFRKGGRT
jgi:hypothetical protein